MLEVFILGDAERIASLTQVERRLSSQIGSPETQSASPGGRAAADGRLCHGHHETEADRVGRSSSTPTVVGMGCDTTSN